MGDRLSVAANLARLVVGVAAFYLIIRGALAWLI